MLLTRLATQYERRRVRGDNAEDIDASAYFCDYSGSWILSTAHSVLIVIFQEVSKSTFSWCEYVELPNVVEGSLLG